MLIFSTRLPVKDTLTKEKFFELVVRWNQDSPHHRIDGIEWDGGYRHRDQDFKRLLAQVGGSRFVERMREPNFIYECTSCHHHYPRMRKMNTKRYVCGKCHGKLILLD